MPKSPLKIRHIGEKEGNSSLRMTNITPIKQKTSQTKVAFDRREMSQILDVYGRLVMSGQAKDYGIGMYRRDAVFAIYRRHAEQPTWSVTKTPALSQAQGAFAVIGLQGHVLKRGKDLKSVLSVFQSRKFNIV